MGCATDLVKTIVFLLNFLCAIVGLALIVVGSLAVAQFKQSDDLTNKLSMVVPGFILAIGIFIFIVSFLGCCGVCQKSQCMLITYTVILLLLFVMQMAISIYGFVEIKGYDDKTRNNIKQDYKHSLRDYNTNQNIKATWDYYQETYECCGVDGFQDYTRPYPLSCCAASKISRNACVTPFVKGCFDYMYDDFLRALKITVYVSLGISFVELVQAFFAICLINSFRNEDRRKY